MSTEDIEEMVRTLLSVSPGRPWFTVTRGIQHTCPDLAGRQGKREINRVVGLMIAHGEVRQEGSSLRLIKDGKTE